jgi:tRNA threonylcarbamoyladenosine biosynthesis protein TsaE
MDRTPAVAARDAELLISRSPEHTLAIGRALGAAAQPGSVIALHGPLGAGKTQLAKGIADGLGVRSVVNSPTFILMNEHIGRLRLFHIDAYRLTEPGEAATAGLLDERQASGVTVIEWAERLGELVPAERISLSIAHEQAASESERVLRWRAFGASHDVLAEVLRREAAR